MPAARAFRQHRVISLAAVLLTAVLAVSAAAVAQDEAASGEVADQGAATQVNGTAQQEPVAGPETRCRAFQHEVTFKRGGQPGKGAVRRDFGAGNGDKGDLVFTDAATGTGLFWTDSAGYLSVYLAAPTGEPGDDELTGLLFEAAPRSIARGDLLDQLATSATSADATSEQLFAVLTEAVRTLDDGCLWSSRFVPRASDRGQLSDFWAGMIGEPGSEPFDSDGGRFRVAVTWPDVAGDTQSATQAVDAVGSDDGTGGSVFDMGDTELLVGLLDACSTNEHFWVFASSATDVEFDITVTDTVSGRTKTYANPLAALPAITDTTAFATCP